MPPEPKISTAEAILLIFFALIADAINWIPILNIISAIITFVITQLYFRMKGVKATWNLVMELPEFIPVISVLPLTTAGVAITIFIDHHPNLVDTAMQTAGAAIPGAAIAAEAARRAGMAGTQVPGGAPSMGGVAAQGGSARPLGRVIPFRKPESSSPREGSEKPRLGGVPKGPFKKAA